MLATLGAIKALFPAPFTGRLAQQWQKSCFRPSSSCFFSSLLLRLLRLPSASASVQTRLRRGVGGGARWRQQQAASVANDKNFEEEDSNHGLVCMHRECQ